MAPSKTHRAGSSGPLRRCRILTGIVADAARRLVGAVALSVAAAGPLTAPAAAEPVWLEVSQAISGTDQRSGQAVVNFILTTAGREVFARFTAAHVGRRIDIRVDGKTWLRPVIQEPVNGGVGQIPVPTVEAGRVLARRLATEGARLEVEAVE